MDHPAESMAKKHEFLRRNEPSLRSLEMTHPERPREELEHILWQAAGLLDGGTEVGRLNIARLLLG